MTIVVLVRVKQAFNVGTGDGCDRGTLRPFVAMMAEYSVNDPSWLELVGSDWKALPFHDPAWTLLLAESMRSSRSCLAAPTKPAA